MKLSENDLKQFIKLKKTIKLIRLRLFLLALILLAALSSYYLAMDVIPAMLGVSLISLLEITFSSHFQKLFDFTERLIDSDPDLLKLKAKLKEPSPKQKKPNFK